MQPTLILKSSFEVVTEKQEAANVSSVRQLHRKHSHLYLSDSIISSFIAFTNQDFPSNQ